jgi:site-specific DNA-methyltransferase (adenine-specific)
MEYLIKTYTNKGMTVLDPFAGSFTTGIACQNLGRHFIGIELDKTYYELGKERMAMNRKLFDLTDC